MKQGLTKDKYTIAEHQLKTNDGLHELYVQEWGSPKGAPVLFLHGGPGAGCNDRQKTIFDAKKHRVVFLDQRGSGNSTPYGSLKDNTTQKLIEDIEQTRNRLSISSWVVVGTSWGSTLALCYAIKHPKRVNKIIIGGVFLGSKEEIDWLEKGHFRTFFPEVDAKVIRKKYTPYQYAKLAIPTIKLDDRYRLPDKLDFDEIPPKIELHFTKNNCFLPDNYILKNAAKLTMPVTIVQGRYDMMTPPKTAYKLNSEFPNSTLIWTIAGHSSNDRENYTAFKAILSQTG